MKNKAFLLLSLVYLMNFIFDMYVLLKTKNFAYISTMIWIITAYMVLWFFFKNNKVQEERIQSRDKLIETLLEERNKRNELI